MKHPLALFSAQNEPLNILKAKKAVHRDGDWHRTAEIVVLNQHGELLLSLRHPDKAHFPNHWDVALGGHLDPGEDYVTAAQRELAEEIGIHVPPADLRWLGVVSLESIHDQPGLIDREHAGVFCWRTTLDVDAFTPQPTEVAALRWLPLDVVLRDLQAAAPTLRYTPPRARYLQMVKMAAS